MEKKTYIAPQMQVVETIAQTSMLISSVAIVDEAGDEMLSNKRRGTWGNLWDDGE